MLDGHDTAIQISLWKVEAVKRGNVLINLLQSCQTVSIFRQSLAFS